MLKKYLPTIILTSVIVVLPMLFGVIMWNKLPDLIQTHWNADGYTGSRSSKAFAVFGMPLILLGVHVLCALVSLIDPKRKNFDGKPFGLVLWICPLMSIVTNSMIYFHSLSGHGIDMRVVMFWVFGILLIIIGNYLPKCGQNYTIGIKTPWALNDPKNWTATHRFGGKVYVVAGVLTFLCAILCAFSAVFFWGIFALIMVACCLPVVYSYIYYAKHGTSEEEPEE